MPLMAHAPHPWIQDVAFTTTALTLIIAARYLIVAWTAHTLIWGDRSGRVAGRRLNRDRPKAAVIRHELTLSLISSPIYAFPAALAFVAWWRGGTLMYTDPGRYGLVWLVAS